MWRRRLWWVVYCQLALLALGTVTYIIWSRTNSSPEAIYRQSLGSVGVGLDTLTSPEALSGFGGNHYRGQLRASGISAAQLESLAGLLTPNNPDGSAGTPCFGPIQPSANQVQANLEADLDLLGQTLLELDLNVNETLAAGLEVRLIPEATEDGTRFNLYFMIDSTDCVIQLAGSELPEGFLGAWWLIDLETWLGDQLPDSPAFSLLTGNPDTADGSSLGDFEQADYDELVGIVTTQIQEYIFTADADKMVLQMGELLDGQADYEGRPALKYSVEIDPDNLAALVDELNRGFWNSQAVRKLVGDDTGTIAAMSQINRAQLRQTIVDFSQKHQIEIWVDAQTRVMRNLRLTNHDPLSPNFGSTWDLGILIDEDNQTIELSTSITNFSLHRQCQTYGLDSDTIAGQPGCPYIAVPDSEPVANLEDDSSQQRCKGDWLDNAETDPDELLRCAGSFFGAPPAFAKQLKENARPDMIHELSLMFDLGGKNLGFSYQVEDPATGLVIAAELEATGQVATAIIAPAGARPIEESGINLPDPAGSQRNNARAADVNQVASGINQYIATRNALPDEWEDIQQIVDPSKFGHYDKTTTNSNTSINPADVIGTSSNSAGQFPTYTALAAAATGQINADEPAAADKIVVMRETGCANRSDHQQGSIREMAILYRLEGQDDIICLEV